MDEGSDLERQLREAREHGQLQAARSEISDLHARVGWQQEQLASLQKALEEARADANAQRSEVERLALLEMQLRGSLEAANASQARERQLQALLDETTQDAELAQEEAERRQRALELELRHARRLAQEARRSAQLTRSAEPRADAEHSGEAWQRQMETLCLGGGSQPLQHTASQLREPMQRAHGASSS